MIPIANGVSLPSAPDAESQVAAALLVLPAADAAKLAKSLNPADYVGPLDRAMVCTAVEMIRSGESLDVLKVKHRLESRPEFKLGGTSAHEYLSNHVE
jgi:hypothetical protein